MAVEELSESRNIYIEKGSAEHKTAENLQRFIDLLNRFDAMTENGFLDRLIIATCRLNDIIDIS